MASVPFEQLLQGLVAEHELQQAVIDDLRNENRLLCEQLGLRNSRESDKDANHDSNAGRHKEKQQKPKSKRVLPGTPSALRLGQGIANGSVASMLEATNDSELGARRPLIATGSEKAPSSLEGSPWTQCCKRHSDPGFNEITLDRNVNQHHQAVSKSGALPYHPRDRQGSTDYSAVRPVPKEIPVRTVPKESHVSSLQVSSIDGMYTPVSSRDGNPVHSAKERTFGSEPNVIKEVYSTGSTEAADNDAAPQRQRLSALEMSALGVKEVNMNPSLDITDAVPSKKSQRTASARSSEAMSCYPSAQILESGFLSQGTIKSEAMSEYPSSRMFQGNQSNQTAGNQNRNFKRLSKESRQKEGDDDQKRVRTKCRFDIEDSQTFATEPSDSDSETQRLSSLLHQKIQFLEQSAQDVDRRSLDSAAKFEGTVFSTTSSERDRSGKVQSPELWPVWTDKQPPTTRKTQMRKTNRNTQAPAIYVESATGSPLFEESGLVNCQYCIIRPNSKKRLAWDVLTILMVGYDVITIPLVALELEPTGFTQAMDWVTSIFWTLDLPGSFLTGYHTEGIVEMRPRAIAMNYIKSWFVFDFSIVTMDWVFLTLEFHDEIDLAGLLRYGKTGRINRILRAMRLLRFMKMQRVLADVLDMVKSEYMQTLCNVGMSILFIVTLNHYLACGWYFTGLVCMREGLPNWIDGSNINGTVALYRYTTSIHWSLTQFTPAGMEVRPYNIAERVYSIVVLLFALITFSSFLGSITTAMTQLRRLRSEQAKQQALLRRYFLDNKVSTELGQRIWKSIKTTHFSHKSRTHTKDIAILRLLPTTLRNSLNEELYRPYVTRIPIFEQYLRMDSEGLCEVCHKAVEESAFVAGDELFSSGQMADLVYLIVSGWLDYTPFESDTSSQVFTGGWVSEHAIWLNWEHCGSLIAATSCEMLLLKPDLTRTILVKYPTALPFLRSYAKFFEKAVRQKFEDNCLATLVEPGGISDVVDIDEVQSCLWRACAEIGGDCKFQVHRSNSSKDGMEVRGRLPFFGKQLSMLGAAMPAKLRRSFEKRGIS